MLAACSTSGTGGEVTSARDEILAVAGIQRTAPEPVASLDRTEFGLVLNDARGSLAPVVSHDILNDVAQGYSGAIVRSGRRIADGDNLHVGTDGSRVSDRVLAAGYDYQWVGENIAQGYDDNEEVVEAWLASDGHREVIMAPEAEDFGIGRTERTWVLIMGKER
ncbi:putative membrane protein [Oceanicola granulosus HTCC2516]|uniref:Putative membrane protein n=1 Tax=Oceanicola granulosus (strain ATCC BAA-861 / DSM 15982 / KCTC 12143 / HTCC2516) TaxID=314256 RepID=Q2CDU3_OCEGH|nr:putative membrane protein [Oceanicola granulosus HTCC2516]